MHKLHFKCCENIYHCYKRNYFTTKITKNTNSRGRHELPFVFNASLTSVLKECKCPCGCFVWKVCVVITCRFTTTTTTTTTLHPLQTQPPQPQQPTLSWMLVFYGVILGYVCCRTLPVQLVVMAPDEWPSELTKQHSFICMSMGW